MNMIQKFIAPAAAAFVLMGSAIAADAATVSPATTTIGSNVEYDYGALSNDTFTDTDIAGGGGINLRDAVVSLVEIVGNGTGSLTIATYVDPYLNSGIGAANILLGIFDSGLPAGSVTVSWGGGPVVDLSDGGQHSISTAFSVAGVAGAKDLVFSWNDVNTQQVSSQLAAVPLPATGLVLLGALGGLGVMRRRRKPA